MSPSKQQRENNRLFVSNDTMGKMSAIVDYSGYSASSGRINNYYERFFL